MIKNKKNNRRHLLVPAVLFLAVIIGSVGCIYFNIPLRTQIYRSICKGNWNLIAVDDTIYATGYCGIRKYVVNDGKAKLLSKNEDFLHNRIIGHGAAVYRDRIFLACRSYLPAPQKNDKAFYDGELIVLDRNLNIHSEIYLPSKMNDAEIIDSILVLSGINRFYIFNVSNPDFPQNTFEYKSKEFKEFQGCALWKAEGKRYVAFTLFTQGIDIWNITDECNPVFVRNIKLMDVSNGKKGLQSLDIKLSYPFLYATLAPTPKYYNTENDVRGVIQMDVTKMDSIHCKAYTIPREDYWKSMPGDPHPKSIVIHNGYIFLSAATSGAAVYEMNCDTLIYKGLTKISSGRNQIWPITMTKSGYLVSGDWNWNKIHVKNKR